MFLNFFDFLHFSSHSFVFYLIIHCHLFFFFSLKLCFFFFSSFFEIFCVSAHCQEIFKMLRFFDFFSFPPPDTPCAGPPWGFTRQPENSKRAHFRVRALHTPPKFHEKIPRERRKNEISGLREQKKREISPPPFGPPPLPGPHPSGPPPLRAPTKNKIGQMRSGQMRPNKDGQIRFGQIRPRPSLRSWSAEGWSPEEGGPKGRRKS